MGLIQREGLVKVELLDNVKRKTIEPLITQTLKQGSQINTDEYQIYNWLEGNYEHKKVNHSRGSTPAMKTKTVSVKFTSTPSKASGRFYVPG